MSARLGAERFLAVEGVQNDRLYQCGQADFAIRCYRFENFQKLAVYSQAGLDTLYIMIVWYHDIIILYLTLALNAKSAQPNN